MICGKIKLGRKPENDTVEKRYDFHKVGPVLEVFQ